MTISTVTGIEKAIRDAKKNNTEVRKRIIGFAGLTLRVRPNGTAEFRHRYTHPIIKTLRPHMTLGHFPTMSLENAKDAYRDNLALIAQNIDPKEYREQQKIQKANEYKFTVGYFVNEVRADLQENLNKGSITKKTVSEKERHLKYIEQAFATVPIKDITPPILYDFFKGLQKRGKSVAVITKGLFSSIYTKAIVSVVVEVNLVDTIKDAWKNKNEPVKHQPAITKPSDFGRLLNDIDRLENTFDHTKDILQLLPLVCCRIGDVCSMRWADIDWDNRQWDLTPQKKGKREDMADVVIPLSNQAISILERMHAKTGDTDFVFYTGRRKLAPHTNEKNINAILNAEVPHAHFMNDGKGYKGVHCPHGFRSSARTMLREQLKYDDLLIELQIGHKMLNPHGRAYARMALMTERTEMMQAWANYLDDLRAGKIDNIIYLQQAKQQTA